MIVQQTSIANVLRELEARGINGELMKVKREGKEIYNDGVFYSENDGNFTANLRWLIEEGEIREGDVVTSEYFNMNYLLV